MWQLILPNRKRWISQPELVCQNGSLPAEPVTMTVEQLKLVDFQKNWCMTLDKADWSAIIGEVEKKTQG
jgi:hypothetical protein